MIRATAGLALLALVLLPHVIAQAGESIAKLEERVEEIESYMADTHRSVRKTVAEIKRLKGQAAADPHGAARRVRKLEATVSDLQKAIAAGAREVARLKLALEKLESGAKVKRGPGLWIAAATPRSTVDLTKKFAKPQIDAVAKTAAGIVRTQVLADLQPRYQTLLTDIQGGDVLVVKGAFDHIDRTLDVLRVRHTKVGAWALAGAKPPKLDGYKIVLWGCDESLRRKQVARTGKALRRFVEKGGFLYTTDWGVENVLPHVFPGRLATHGKHGHLPEMIVKIAAWDAKSKSPYLRGVLVPGMTTSWWLEQAAFDMKTGSAFRGVELLRADQLDHVFKRSPLVAAVFAAGKGRVLHSMGHAWQEAGNLAGTIAAQRLLLNFLLQAQLPPEKRPYDGLGAKR